MERFLTVGSNSFSLSPFSPFPSPFIFYKLAPRDEEYLGPDHVMVIVIIHPGLSSLSMGRLKPRNGHSNQKPHHHHPIAQPYWAASGAAARVGQP